MVSKSRVHVLCLCLAFVVVVPSFAAEPDGHGGGERVRPEEPPHLTEAQRRDYRAIVEATNARLIAEGRLRIFTDAARPEFTWPLAPASDFTDYGYHGVSNFVDQQSSLGLLDYGCGERSYEGHKGTDYFLWPFEWLKMDTDRVAVVAAAPGTISYRHDGQFDRSCSFGGTWNAVYVTHEDGSVAWYGHLKNGSVTSKGVGETVERGEYLGIVGSSGSSTAPHLHFEVYETSGVLNDPYDGACNGLNADTWWQSQRPYYDSAINHVATGFAAPVFPPCPQQETPNEANSFVPGDAVYFLTYYRDQLQSQTSSYVIRRPDGSVYNDWTHNSDAPHYAASYWYWYWNSFAPGGPTGFWKFEVTFDGQTYEHDFVLRDTGGAGSVPGHAASPGTPMKMAKEADGALRFDWSESCVSSDFDYAVYEGFLGDFTSHLPRQCSTGGATTATLVPQSASSYYLIVPSNGTFEGSHGTDSALAERPRGPSSCMDQAAGGCP